MYSVIKTVDIGNGYRAEVSYDDSPECPTNDIQWCTMVIIHRNYTTGHTHWRDRLADDVWHAHSRLVGGDGADGFTEEEIEFLATFSVCDDDSVRRLFVVPDGDADNSLADRLGWLVLDVYLYDHSGVVYRTHPFGCRWDSGQCGVIYTTPKAIREFLNGGEVAPVDWKRIKEAMSTVVDEYSKWANGDVYMVTILDGDDESHDSCCGFYDMEDVDEYIEEQRDAFSQRVAWMPGTDRLVALLETEVAKEEHQNTGREDYIEGLKFAIKTARECL